MESPKKYSLSRYERHIDVPEIGVNGQKRLLESSVLIVGVGGLGCPAALYLHAAGIGKIGLVDADTVSTSNLQRQILFTDEDTGKPKVDIAKKALSKNNTYCQINTYPFFLTDDNAQETIRDYDVVLDCTDNFKTRYTINHWCIKEKKPLISASIYHYDGQISTFRGYQPDAPCYQCLYKKTDENWIIPQCTEGGVVGPLAGIMGTMQATATLNELLGTGDSLSGWMLLVNALTFETQKVRLFKGSDCEACRKGADHFPPSEQIKTVCMTGD